MRRPAVQRASSPLGSTTRIDQFSRLWRLGHKARRDFPEPFGPMVTIWRPPTENSGPPVSGGGPSVVLEPTPKETPRSVAQIFSIGRRSPIHLAMCRFSFKIRARAGGATRARFAGARTDDRGRVGGKP